MAADVIRAKFECPESGTVSSPARGWVEPGLLKGCLWTALDALKLVLLGGEKTWVGTGVLCEGTCLSGGIYKGIIFG